MQLWHLTSRTRRNMQALSANVFGWERFEVRGLYVECCQRLVQGEHYFSSEFPMLSRDLRRTRNTGSIRLPDRSRHLPTYEVRLALNRAITAGTSLRQFRQLHSYSTALRCVVWPHLLHMYLPSTCATMRRNSKPDTQ